jgi:superfamily I DNA/RNA helicase
MREVTSGSIASAGLLSFARFIAVMLEEECCLFHVALTRAKDEPYLP